MIRQYELVERVRSYDPDADEDLINRAYVFSMKAHGQQTRASGDPYFVHPLEVAGLLADMKLDSATIVTGLLHDTVEDTVATLDELETQFGIEVSALVDGVTKLSKLEHQSDQSKQAENFRKLVLAMSKDIRVLLVKLCDRLHNMRTLGALKRPERRARIARETLEIYAPLAERIGMHVMKDELEDLAFIYLNNDARDSIVRRLVQLRTEDSGTIGRVVDGLKQVLEDGGITGALVVGREKRPYSIWRKMHVRNVPFEQMADIMAFRIIVDTMEECYQALGLIHACYSSLPGRFKDYISTPKPNGYQSVHTAVIGPFRQRIEIQIRTQEMHQVAELGVAAHWIYKQDHGAPGSNKEPPYKWLRELLEILDNVEKPVEFLEHTKLELFQDQVFCFTPKGLVIALPQGATPIDFAYAVHTQVGDTCVGAKVNGRMTTLRTILRNGDQVEIITSKTSTPSPEWMRTAVTGKARSRIRRFIRQKQRAEYAELGKAMLQKLFRQEGVDFSERIMEGVLKAFRLAHTDDLYANVGSGVTAAREVFTATYPDHRTGQQRDENVIPLVRPRSKSQKGTPSSVAIRGLIPGMAVHYARCCHPIPGDRIVGIVTTGKGVTIHTIDCETLDSFYDQPERWLDVSWNSEAENADDHVGRLAAVICNEPGSLGTLTTVIGKNGGNITNLKFTHRSIDFFELFVDIEVKDIKQLTSIIAALRSTPVISSVERARSV